eukprot:1156659-Pelagomonas_calceolata.AAC.1
MVMLASVLPGPPVQAAWHSAPAKPCWTGPTLLPLCCCCLLWVMASTGVLPASQAGHPCQPSQAAWASACFLSHSSTCSVVQHTSEKVLRPSAAWGCNLGPTDCLV